MSIGVAPMKYEDGYIARRLRSHFDLSRPVIFYGAGDEALYYVNSFKQIGVEPVCFADRDKKKHYMHQCDRIILPLDDAVKQFPNPQIFISTNEKSWTSISEEIVLSGLINTSQIINKKMRKHTTCYWLENQIVTYDSQNAHYLIPCCVWWGDGMPMVEVNNENYDETVFRYILTRDAATKSLNLQDGAYCIGCPYKQESSVWFGNWTFKELNFGEHGICNFKCIYCTGNRSRPINKDRVRYINYDMLISQLEKYELINKDLCITVGMGEITVHPKCDEILSICNRYKNVLLLTNAYIYNEKVFNLLNNPKARINVSLDAGTRKTFSRIKRNDAFDKVCANLKKYASNEGNIELKYILLPSINDNMEDANGFLKVCLEINASMVVLSKNRDDKRPLASDTQMIARYIFNKAREFGIAAKLDVFFSQDEVCGITDCY